MKQAIYVILVIIAAIGTMAAIIVTLESEPRARVTVTQQEQPQRQQYQAPEWVVNERGQRCIKQGSTVTCG
jgi:flagellar basal body-associated protein FliL